MKNLKILIKSHFKQIKIYREKVIVISKKNYNYF